MSGMDSIACVSPDRLDFYDAELRAHHKHLRASYGISPGDEVLDLGCGAGLTTREAARAAEPGCVAGVDISERGTLDDDNKTVDILRTHP